MARIPPSILAMAAILALTGPGCRETGDFGRPLDTAWTASIAPGITKQAARLRGEPASSFPLTDDERELRERAYHFLMPAQDTDIILSQVASLVRERMLPANATLFDPSAYSRRLANEADRSPRARYQRLREDIEADRQLFGPFVALACRVEANDVIRLRALERIGAAEPETARNAHERVAENAELTAWVKSAAAQRSRAYRYALEQLVVATPDRDAIRSERQLTGLDSDLIALDRCHDRAASTPIARSGAPAYMPRPDKPDLPPK